MVDRKKRLVRDLQPPGTGDINQPDQLEEVDFSAHCFIIFSLGACSRGGNQAKRTTAAGPYVLQLGIKIPTYYANQVQYALKFIHEQAQLLSNFRVLEEKGKI